MKNYHFLFSFADTLNMTDMTQIFILQLLFVHISQHALYSSQRTVVLFALSNVERATVKTEEQDVFFLGDL